MSYLPSAVTCRIAGGICLAVALSGCAHSQPPTSSYQTASNPAPLNVLSAARVVDSMANAGLPTLNRHDVTKDKCPKLRCAEAIETDSVSVFKFPATGIAQQYAGSRSNVYQIEDIVLDFAPTVSADLKDRYETVVERAAA